MAGWSFSSGQRRWSDPDKHQIIKIGAVRVSRDSTHHTMCQVLVKTNDKLPRKIMEMTGITTEMLEREGESLEVAIAKFLEFAGNPRLVAFNAPFDLAFLSRAAAHEAAKTAPRNSPDLEMIYDKEKQKGNASVTTAPWKGIHFRELAALPTFSHSAKTRLI